MRPHFDTFGVGNKAFAHFAKPVSAKWAMTLCLIFGVQMGASVFEGTPFLGGFKGGGVFFLN